MQWAEMTEHERDRYRHYAGFTDRERDVFDLRARGKSILEIAQATNLSTSTVNRRIKSIKTKMARS